MTADPSPRPTSEGAPRQRPGGRTARTREAVLDAAAALLTEMPPADVTVALVAARAGVNEVTIYRKWGTKDALLGDVLLTLSGERLPAPDTGDLRNDLLSFIGSVADFLRTPAGYALVYLSATAGDESAAVLRDRFWDDRFSRARIVFDRAVERGELADPEAGMLGYEAMIGALHFRLLERRKPLEEDIARRLVDLVLTGIAAATGARGDDV